MEIHEILFIFIAFFSELIGTASGVSSSTLFVPLGFMLEGVQITLALTACLHVLGNLTRLFLFWKHIDWFLTLRFGIPALLLAGIGAYFSDLLPKEIFAVVLGVFLIGISILFYRKKESVKIKDKWLSYFGGGLSGFLTGLLGSGGAIRSLALAAFNLNPMTFTATSTLIDFGGDVVRLQIYLSKGYLNSDYYFYIPLFAVVAVLANWIAKKWLQKLNKEKFKKIVLAFVFISGVFSIVSSFIN